MSTVGSEVRRRLRIWHYSQGEDLYNERIEVEVNVGGDCGDGGWSLEVEVEMETGNEGEVKSCLISRLMSRGNL